MLSEEFQRMVPIMVPGELFSEECPLSNKEKIVFIVCSQYEKRFGDITHESIEAMVRKAKMPEKEFRKALKGLVKKGYMNG